MNLKNGVFRGTPLYIVAIFVLLAGMIVSLLVAVTIGSVDLTVGEVYRVILFRLLGIGDPSLFGDGTATGDIVWYVRLPRLVLALGVGVSLSVSGVIMQAIVKNPLADPYVLGVSSGASLGATLAIMTGLGSFLGSNFVGIMAFVGAFLVSLAVVALANIGGRATSVKLLLAGTALAALCSAFSSFALFIKNSTGAVQAVVRWTMGSLAGANWNGNVVVLVVAAAGLAFFWTQHRTLNLMLLGDDSAITLGTDLHGWRIVYLLVSALLVGFAVYAAGIIAFVGLVVPHVIRMLFGTDHKKLVPLSALLGGIFLLWADVLCRTIIPKAELPIGIFTAMVGAPVFIYLMARKKYGFGGKD